MESTLASLLLSMVIHKRQGDNSFRIPLIPVRKRSHPCKPEMIKSRKARVRKNKFLVVRQEACETVIIPIGKFRKSSELRQNSEGLQHCGPKSHSYKIASLAGMHLTHGTENHPST